MASSAKNKDTKKSFFGNLFKKKKVTTRPAYVPSIHPNMSHNNIIRMRNMSNAHKKAMNEYNAASQGFVRLSNQSPRSNTALYGQLPSRFNTYAKVTTKKQDRERNRLISRIRKSFNDNESIKTKIMSRLISNEDNIKSLNNLNSMNNSLIKKINRLIPVYENNRSTRLAPSMNISYQHPYSMPVFNTLTGTNPESGSKRENPYGENGEDRPSRRNEPHINVPIVYASLNQAALRKPTGTSQPREETNYGTVAGTQTNTGQIVPLRGSKPTREQQELLLKELMKSGNARENGPPSSSHAGGARKRTRKHNNKKSKSKSRKHRK